MFAYWSLEIQEFTPNPIPLAVGGHLEPPGTKLGFITARSSYTNRKTSNRYPSEKKDLKVF